MGWVSVLAFFLKQFAAKRVAFCRKTKCNLPQNAWCYAAKYRAVLRQNAGTICRKMEAGWNAPELQGLFASLEFNIAGQFEPFPVAGYSDAVALSLAQRVDGVVLAAERCCEVFAAIVIDDA